MTALTPPPPPPRLPPAGAALGGGRRAAGPHTGGVRAERLEGAGRHVSSLSGRWRGRARTGDGVGAPFGANAFSAHGGGK